MRYCLGIILYNPNNENFENIRKYRDANLFSDIIVYDNSETSNCLNIPDGIQYIWTGQNDGLSKPYNRMIQFAIDGKFDYLCLLDQDSQYDKDEIKNMIDYLEANHNMLCDTAIIAPRTYSATSKRVERAERVSEVTFAINSGSFLNIQIIKGSGLRYDENIFLDGVDLDFCWSVRENNKKVLVYDNSVFYQSLGYNVANVAFNRHSAFRYYYIAHNKKYILIKHEGKLIGSIKAFVSNCLLMYKILRFEDNRKRKLCSCFKGMIW